MNPRSPVRPPSGNPVAPSPEIKTRQEILRVAAFGDSIMWGQGLRRDETFAALITRGLGLQHEMNAMLVVNRSRSGAVLNDGKTKQEREARRREFLDTFPALFSSARERKLFLEGNDSRASDLYGEIPASFPTVRWQVDSLNDEEGKRIDVALLSGGANDIDFELILDPTNGSGAFVEVFDDRIRSIAYDDILEQIRRTRAKCPNAVIMVFGYFAPISYKSHKSKIRAYFKYAFDNDSLWLLNKAVQYTPIALLTDKDMPIEPLIEEARARAVWGQSRAQHWIRKAVTDANRMEDVRGPGVIFIPSGMKWFNSAFANKPQVYEEYRHPTSDNAQRERLDQCPRIQQLDMLREVHDLFSNLSYGTSGGDSRAQTHLLRSAVLLRDAIDGPESLINALNDYIESPDMRLRKKVAELIDKERHRIQRVLIASFLHPNSAGASRYASNALARYQEHRRISTAVKQKKRTDAAKPPGKKSVTSAVLAGAPETIEKKLTRYRVRGTGSLLADLNHLNVDAFWVTTVTQQDSDPNLVPDVFLVVDTIDDMGTVGSRQYPLNFPYQIRLFQSQSPKYRLRVKKLYPQFEPGMTDHFTIDTGNDLRLEHIVGIKLVLGSDQYAGKQIHNPYGKIWRPQQVTFQINGIQVLDQKFRARTIQPGGELILDYPSARPVEAKPNTKI